MAITTLVKRSPFENVYGGLELRRDDDGRFFLVMDCVVSGGEFGPLTDKEVEAFHTLCDVPEYHALSKASSHRRLQIDNPGRSNS